MSGLNLKVMMRDLKCTDCKEEYRSNEPNPICPYCGGTAIRVVKSVLVSETNTGEK